ncbi:MAG: GNAT family N-acetyltransferase [Roseibium sp.]|uniref:GNAT family N-acetyltransferase n=1 Tax=Roseibium sp. TaxID=1936156 RepID=UPI002624E5E9|nr:GNAT family N-acetyltransferase [Roseibium sp.]MCV0423991.1 GNAT family N-acetyltransferase [Roseibium sp.]
MAGMSCILEKLVVTGVRSKPFSSSFVRAYYVEHPHRIECTVVENERGQIIGFQSLKRAIQDNPYDIPPGWGVIGTHVGPEVTRRGLGRRLFSVSFGVAKKENISKICAFFGTENSGALAYYEAMGFEACKSTKNWVQMCFEVI